MRIIRIYQFLPPLGGGMEKHVHSLSLEQRALGCDVVVVFNSGAKTAENDIQILQGKNTRLIRPQFLRDLVFFAFAILKLLRCRARADVVHVHGDWSAFLLGRIVKKVTGATTLVAGIHGAVRRGRWGSIYKRILEPYAMAYCTGADDAAYLQNQGIRSVRWQSSGVSSEFYAPVASVSGSGAAFDVVCVANFFPVKNLFLLINIAIAAPEVRFLIVGDGPQKSSFLEACERADVKNICVAGRLSTKQLALKLTEAKIFLSVSISEGTPTAMLEAMARGLPVVTSASNKFDDFLRNGENGYVIQGFSAGDYVDVIRRLMKDDGLRKNISLTNLADSKKFSWSVVASRITQWMIDSKK